MPSSASQQASANITPQKTNGAFAETFRLLDEALSREESSPLWCEWAMLQTAQNCFAEAEEGYSRALALDPGNTRAAVNLGALLAAQGRKAEAVPYLERCAESAEGPLRASASRILEECRRAPINRQNISSEDTSQLFRRVAHLFEGGEELMRQYYSCLLPLFSAGERVLDLGCGRGTFLEELAKRGVDGIGVELDPARAAEAEAKGLKVYRQTIGEFIAAFREPVDGVCLMHVIEHIEGEAAFGLLAQLRNLLNPGGRLILVTPNFAHGMVSAENFWLDITHKRPYPLPLLRGMIETLGMDTIEARVSPWNEIDLLAVGRKR